MPPVFDPKKVAPFLRGLVADERTGDLIVLALERAILRDARYRFTEFDADHHPAAATMEPGPVRAELLLREFLETLVSSDEKEELRHVADWLSAAVADDAPWLRRTDAAGRPLKLLKIGSVGRAVAEADKAMRRRLGGSGPSGHDRKGDEVHLALDDGWSLVRLSTPAALDAESEAMRHCVGHGAYDTRLEDGTRTFLSLRDPEGRPHATLEIDAARGSMVQLQGRANRKLPGPHMVRLLPYLSGLPLGEDALTWHDLVRDVEGNLWHVSRLPDGIALKSRSINVDLGREGTKLPSKLLVAEHLSIVAPRGETVALPAVLHVGGVVRLVGNFVFPSGMELRARGMDLENGTFSNLPENLRIEGMLHVFESTIEDLPRGLAVADLNLNRSAIGRIPADARIDHVRIQDMPWSILPDDMRLESLEIRGREAGSLPAGLTVERDLRLWSCPVAEIGPRTRIGGDLSMRAMPGPVSLPDHLVVGGSISFEAAPGADAHEGVAAPSPGSDDGPQASRRP